MLLLQDSPHRFVSQLLGTYVGDTCLYMLLVSNQTIGINFADLLCQADGGQVLGEEHAKFYTACIASVLAHLHNIEIAYRGVDSNTIGIDALGYPVFYDFFLAKDLRSEGRTSTLVGAKEYFAPEQVGAGNGHGVAVDMWALGVLLYEMMVGSTPFVSESGKSETQMYDAIISHKEGTLSISSASKNCNEILNRLVSPTEERRISAGKTLRHSWFSDLDMKQFLNPQNSTPGPFSKEVEALFRGVYQKAGVSKSSGSTSAVEAVPYMGDTSWFEEF